ILAQGDDAFRCFCKRLFIAAVLNRQRISGRKGGARSGEEQSYCADDVFHGTLSFINFMLRCPGGEQNVNETHYYGEALYNVIYLVSMNDSNAMKSLGIVRAKGGEAKQPGAQVARSGRLV